MLPYTRVGVVGGVMLGLGRALGETMAVTFVIGNSHTIAASLLSPATTISATIANEFQESDGVYRSALLELGLLLVRHHLLRSGDRAASCSCASSARREPDHGVLRIPPR